MNQFIANLKNVFTNLHVSLPVLLGAVLFILPVWFPKYADQLKATAAVLTAYGIIGAANTPGPKQTLAKP
jgi:hypothetical protein